MTPLRKLAVAAHVVGVATPTAVMASVEYENHPGGVVLATVLLAGAASVVALAAAAGHAPEAWAVLTEPEPEPRADTAVMDAAVTEYDAMRVRPPTVVPEPGADPLTRWDLSAIEDTQQIKRIDPPADNWAAMPGVWQVPVVPAAAVEDLYAHPGNQWPADVAERQAWLDDWFAPAAERQRGRAA